MPTQPSPIGNTVGPLAPSRRGGYVREVMPVDRGSLGRFRQERLVGTPFTRLPWASRRARRCRASAQPLAAGGFEFLEGQPINAQGADALLRMLQIKDMTLL